MPTLARSAAIRPAMRRSREVAGTARSTGPWPALPTWASSFRACAGSWAQAGPAVAVGRQSFQRPGGGDLVERHRREADLVVLQGEPGGLLVRHGDHADALQVRPAAAVGRAGDQLDR